MENPYQSPERPDQIPPAPTGIRIVTWYRIAAAVEFVALIGVSVFLAYRSSDKSPISLDNIYLVVRAELLGVLLALAAVVAFLIRAGYLLVVGRFRDAAIDALFAGAAFAAFYFALIINPISV